MWHLQQHVTSCGGLRSGVPFQLLWRAGDSLQNCNYLYATTPSFKIGPWLAHHSFLLKAWVDQSGTAGAHWETPPAEHAAVVVKWRVHVLLKSFTVLNTCSVAVWQRRLSFIFILSCYIRSRLSEPEGRYLNTLISTSGTCPISRTTSYNSCIVPLLSDSTSNLVDLASFILHQTTIQVLWH